MPSGLEAVKACYVMCNSRFTFGVDLRRVTYDEERLGEANIAHRVRQLGYEAMPGDTMQKSTLIVEEMDCTDESSIIEKKLRSAPGILDLHFNLIAQEVTVTHGLTVQ